MTTEDRIQRRADRLRAQRSTESSIKWTPEMRAKLDAQVKELVDEAPPLTEAQRDRLAVILRGARGRQS